MGLGDAGDLQLTLSDGSAVGTGDLPGGQESYGPSLSDAFGSGAYQDTSGYIHDSTGQIVAGGPLSGGPTIFDTGSSGPGIGTSIVQGISNIGSAVLPKLFGPSTPTTTPKSGVGGFLTSAPVLIGGAVLVGLLLLRRKKAAA